MSASAGVSIKELTAHMGHSNTRAAMICQYSTNVRRHNMTRKLDDLARGALKDQSGTSSKATF
ncbi:hypothetical protein ABZ917_07065 [Nonomuraea wenchangensis]